MRLEDRVVSIESRLTDIDAVLNRMSPLSTEDVEGHIRALNVEIARLKTKIDDGALVVESRESSNVSVFKSSELARGFWCVTGLRSGYTLSTTPADWDAAFDNSTNAAYRMFKGGLSRYGELSHNYDGVANAARHRMKFRNFGNEFTAIMYVYLTSGSIGGAGAQCAVKMNGTLTTLTAEGSVTLTIRSGDNDLAILHRAGMIVETWVQFLDGKNVRCLDFTCGKIGASDGGSGGSGGPGQGEST